MEAPPDSLSASERDLVATIRADHGAADESILGDPAIRSNLEAANLEGARQWQAGPVADWVGDALPWGFRLADISPCRPLGRRARSRPGTARRREIQRLIPECAVRTEAAAGHWPVASHWPEILRRLVR